MQQYNLKPKEFFQNPVKLLIFDFDGVLVDTQAIVNEIQFDYFKKLYPLDLTLQQFAEKFSGMQIKTIVEILQKEKNSISFPPEKKISLEIDNFTL